mmetsp:Transcript_41248/g.128581  ORF Transcript_41248/g.128581 Transcript_41248/m.128581 type:complete len:246 (-) Transcript_41248:1513-2250(-)
MTSLSAWWLLLPTVRRSHHQESRPRRRSRAPANRFCQASSLRLGARSPLVLCKLGSNSEGRAAAPLSLVPPCAPGQLVARRRSRPRSPRCARRRRRCSARGRPQERRPVRSGRPTTAKLSSRLQSPRCERHCRRMAVGRAAYQAEAQPLRLLALAAAVDQGSRWLPLAMSTSTWFRAVLSCAGCSEPAGASIRGAGDPAVAGAHAEQDRLRGCIGSSSSSSRTRRSWTGCVTRTPRASSVCRSSS